MSCSVSGWPALAAPVLENGLLSSSGALFCLSSCQLHVQGVQGFILDWDFSERKWQEFRCVSLPHFLCPLEREESSWNSKHLLCTSLMTEVFKLGHNAWDQLMSITFLSVIEETTECCSCSFTPTSSVSAKIYFLHLWPYLACCPPTICIFVMYFKWAIKYPFT